MGQGTVGRKSHDPSFHVFLMEARVTTFAAHCTSVLLQDIIMQGKKINHR